MALAYPTESNRNEARHDTESVHLRRFPAKLRGERHPSRHPAIANEWEAREAIVLRSLRARLRITAIRISIRKHLTLREDWNHQPWDRRE
jgi:hypothetical protein